MAKVGSDGGQFEKVNKELVFASSNTFIYAKYKN
tara:strand:+ start:519 stop:620 length:102 start_codon:yes stop_codon:yes gene_type:complete